MDNENIFRDETDFQIKLIDSLSSEAGAIWRKKEALADGMLSLIELCGDNTNYPDCRNGCEQYIENPCLKCENKNKRNC